MPLEIERLGADFAVGGSVKWLCGGPGAGYLYVRAGPGERAASRGSSAGRRTRTPFEFAAGAIEYADAPERFQSGTPNVPSLYSARAGYEIVAEIGVAADPREVPQADAAADGTARRRPASASTRRRLTRERGGAVIVDVPNGEAVADELIRREVIVDYRPGAGIRMAPHFYNTAEEIEHAMGVLSEIVVTAAR